MHSATAPPTAPIPTHSVSCNVRSVCKISASTGCIRARHTSLSVKEGPPPSLEGVWPYLELSHRRREATAVHTRTRCHAADELESSAHSRPTAGATAWWYGRAAAPCIALSRGRYVGCTHGAPTLRPARDPRLPGVELRAGWIFSCVYPDSDIPLTSPSGYLWGPAKRHRERRGVCRLWGILATDSVGDLHG